MDEAVQPWICAAVALARAQFADQPKPLAEAMARIDDRAAKLVELGVETIGEARRLLREGQPEQRRAMVGLAGSLDLQPLIDDLLDLLEDGAEDVALRSDVACSLDELLFSDRHPEAKERIHRLMRSDDADDRSVAVKAVCLISATRTSRDALLAVLRDPDERTETRGEAAEALAGVCWRPNKYCRRDREVEQEMLRGLDDPEPEIRFWSIFALGEMCCRAALPRLRELAHDPHPRSISGLWTVAEEAVDTIAKLEGREVEARQPRWEKPA